MENEVLPIDIRVAVIEAAVKLSIEKKRKFKYCLEVVLDAMDTINDGKYTKEI